MLSAISPPLNNAIQSDSERTSFAFCVSAVLLQPALQPSVSSEVLTPATSRGEHDDMFEGTVAEAFACTSSKQIR
jgi:hypothetical protein